MLTHDTIPRASRGFASGFSVAGHGSVQWMSLRDMQYRGRECPAVECDAREYRIGNPRQHWRETLGAMMKTIAWVICFLTLICPAFADSTINNLSSGTALGGTEQIPMYQGSNPAVTTTPNAIKTYLGNATNAAKGLAQGDGQTITCVTGICSGIAPDNTFTISHTLVATDMGGQVNFNNSSLTVTIPAISSTVLANGMSVIINNYNSSPLTISTTPTINGFNGTSIPQYGGISCVSNGTSLDCVGLGVLANEGFLNKTQVWSAQQSASFTTLSISTATFTPDGSNNDYALTLVHAACPCTLANPSVTPVAGTHGVIIVTQSSTGSDTIGTWGSYYQAPGGTSTITLSTGVNAVDVLGYVVKDSTHILLVPATNFSH
jgi:hypothetical protein